MFEKIRRSGLTDYTISIDIVNDFNKGIRITDERIARLKDAGYEVFYMPSNINVGHILKITLGKTIKYVMKVSSKNEYSSWGQQQQAFVILKSNLDYRNDKIKRIKDKIKKEQNSNDN